MRKIAVFVPILLLAVLVLVGAGCGEKAVEEEGAPVAGEEEEEEEVSLEEVLVKAKDLGGYKFDVVLERTGQPTMTSKMWVEGADMRWEGTVEGQSVVYILNIAQQKAYIYLPDQNMAMEYNFAKARETVGKSPDEQSEEISTEYPDAEVLGTEVWDGKTCLVVQGVSDEGDVTKWWLWIQHGIPIKVELTSHTGEVIVTKLRNIELGDIPDSMFELPAGVETMEIPLFGF